MSNIYNTEPPTKGKVVLVTSHGDVDVELWAKEAPKVLFCCCCCVRVLSPRSPIAVFRPRLSPLHPPPA
jgi:hypothetical protein